MKNRFLTPQQELFLAEYINPKSPNFGNAKQSALKAKYSETYAENITDEMPDWLSENLGDHKLIKKATKNLEMALDGELDEVQKSKILQYKATEFTLKTLRKDKFSERTELTGKGGEALQPILVKFLDAKNTEDNRHTNRV